MASRRLISTTVFAATTSSYSGSMSGWKSNKKIVWSVIIVDNSDAIFICFNGPGVTRVSPTKAPLLDKTQVARFKTYNAQKPRLHKLLRDNLVSRKLSSLYQGLHFRQLFLPHPPHSPRLIIVASRAS
ncbi:hypothetical protein PtB15_10B228 [Puccinia triticina]|nr:hypothetical protein PtB15_10B228 [Puccinia triticina]